MSEYQQHQKLLEKYLPPETIAAIGDGFAGVVCIELCRRIQAAESSQITTPTTGAVARFEEVANEWQKLLRLSPSTDWVLKVVASMECGLSALAEQAAEIERLKQTINDAKREHEEMKADHELRLKQALADARAAGVREGPKKPSLPPLDTNKICYSSRTHCQVCGLPHPCGCVAQKLRGKGGT